MAGTMKSPSVHHAPSPSSVVAMVVVVVIP